MADFPPISPKAPYLWHGGDYNPEQWSPDVWDDDFRLMQKAGMTSATVGVFSWVSLQPAEDQFTFDWLDEIMDRMHRQGMHAVLATPSAAHPAWAAQKYPGIQRADRHGVRRPFGMRVNYCPNSPDYRRLSATVARKLAERYKDHPALMLWHVSNEYGDACYCETCAAEFRRWLQAKYGTLDELNARWWTYFWGHAYTDWEQIQPPLEGGQFMVHGLSLDYRRFMTDSTIACYENERDVLRAITPDVPITTNLMGAYKPLDYRKLAKSMDLTAWDSYPQPRDSASDIAFLHDLTRGLKDGQPFLLMEQTPSSQNWQAVNALKPPGVLRLWSFLAVAHGADSVQYFQWRRGRGGCEKMHGAVIDHAGSDQTRVFREVSQIGVELSALGDSIVGASTPAEVAILFDWENWWALEDSIGPVRDKKYLATVRKHYAPWFNQNAPVDVVFPDSDFSRYKVLIAPMLYLTTPVLGEKIERYVEGGGILLTTYLSGIADETDLVYTTGYPGPLRAVTGVWVEEFDALYEDRPNTLVMADGSAAYSCGHVADLLHLEGATVLATYGKDWYAGRPALTVNQFGAGKAYYLATDPDTAFLEVFYRGIAAEAGVVSAAQTPPGVEVAVRRKCDADLLFLLNHNPQAAQVELPEGGYTDLLAGTPVSGVQISLAGYDVRILRRVRE